MVQLLLAGMLAPLNVTVLAVLVRATVAPLHEVAGAKDVDPEDVAMLRFAGSVSVKLDCARANPLALASVMVNVETTFSPTLAGENASVTVGATGVTVKALGHAEALVPAVVGVVVAAIAPLALTVRVAVSMAPAESVTVRVMVPDAPVGTTVTWAVLAADCSVAPAPTTHAYEAIVRPQDAALPLASRTAEAPVAVVAGTMTAAIGRSAALTAFSAFTMPAPH
jgi:hypothetical protein